MALRLGIDTGGTFTDAVLVDCDGHVIASSKQLTTRHDLTIGIGNTLRALPPEALAEVEMVALSTTLSTNSVVEGRGAPVCVLLPGYRPEQVEKSCLLDVLNEDQVVILPGAHNSLGEEIQVLDENLARAAILQHSEQAAAFAISGMFGTRNPTHEQRLRAMVVDLASRPVTCGHELASDLGAPRRALTVALNARMIPTIHRLIVAMQSILRELGVDAPLMMVKGDGSLINTETALRKPVGTVLSGPAASVLGACAISGSSNAIIADMGGTTTDIAVVSDGKPELGTDGVRIGELEPMVEAVRVFSIGLGGDSEVRFGGHSQVVIGPRRVVPVSLLACEHEHVLDVLRRQLSQGPDRRNNRFVMRLESSPEMLNRLTTLETEAWGLLAEGPVEFRAVIEQDRGMARALARLERIGLAIYSGFTPSDATHVLGMSTHWSAEAADLAALIWAGQMRHIYGLGRWQEGDATGPSQHVFDLVTRKIARALIEAGLHQHRQLSESNARKLTGLLTDLVLNSGHTEDTQSLFYPKFAAEYPLVAVGAPAATFYPPVAELLNLGLSLPRHAEVANAYGAVMCSVMQRAVVTITQPRHGRFVLHSHEAPRRFSELDQAVNIAGELATERARQLARDAGAGEVSVHLSRESNHVHHDIDGELFLEMKITAIANGRPSQAQGVDKSRARNSR